MTSRKRVHALAAATLPLLLSAALPSNAQIISGMLMGNDHNIVVQTCLPNREEPVLLRTEVTDEQWSNLVDTNMKVGIPAIPDPNLRDKYMRHNMVRLNVTLDGSVSMGGVSGAGGNMYHGTLDVNNVMISGASRGLRGRCVQ